MPQIPTDYDGILVTVVIAAMILSAGCMTAGPEQRAPALGSISGLTLYTEENFPYNYDENGTLYGISIDLFEAITKEMGDPVSRDKVRLVPWSEGYQAALHGNSTMIFAIARLDARESSFKWAGPIPPYTTVVFAKKDAGIVINEPGDLTAYRIGAVKDDAAVQELLNAGVNSDNIVIVPEESMLISGIQNGTIDLWADSEITGRIMAKKMTGSADTYTVVTSFPSIPIYFGFSRDVPDSTVTSFQHALDAIKAERDANGTSTYQKILASYIPGGSTAQPEQLTFYTEQLPPYNYIENGTLKGISVDLLEAVTEKTGSKVTRDNVQLVPWTVGYQATLARNNTALFTTVRIPARENSFKWAGPVYAYTNVLFARPDRGITITSPNDLKNYRIGVIVDDVAVRQLLDAGVPEGQLVQETNASVLVEKLERGAIDLWAYPEPTGRYLTGQVTGNEYSFRVVYTLEAREGWYAFNRDVPDSAVASFQQGLDTLKKEKDAKGISTYERIVGRYVPSIGLAQLNYLTEEWPPFNYMRDGRPSGIGVEILEAAFRNLGVNLTGADVKIVPLSEGFERTKAGGSVLFSIVRSPEREPFYQWAGPFTKGSFVVYAPVSRNIMITAPADLNKYRIGAVKGTIENTLLTDRGVNASHIVNGLVPADLIGMLEKDAIDVWATGDVTGRYEMQVAGVNPDKYEIVYVLSENDFYFIFSKDVPENLVHAFSQSLMMVRNQHDAQGITEYERIIYRNIGVGCARPVFTDADVMALVNTTAADISRDAPGTFRRINAGEVPYLNGENRELYVYVFDTNLTLTAHAANPLNIGENFRGKPDVTGTMFRDEILEGALANGSGSQEYVYTNPVQMNLFYKTAYYMRVKGSDGKTYVVASGNFKACNG